jgi:RNA polymerase sigma-70 factor (ECF subfamily)
MPDNLGRGLNRIGVGGPPNCEESEIRPGAKEERGVTEDVRWLSRVAEGDRAAFRLLYEHHANRVYRYALSLLRRPHLAEEVLQETMLAVWKGAGAFKGAAKVSTWILGIARNQAFNLLRREDRGQRLPEESGEIRDPAPEIERSVAVGSALDVLPIAQRDVLHLVYYENLTLREAADVLGIPEGTAKSRMYHARRTLARELA